MLAIAAMIVTLSGGHAPKNCEEFSAMLFDASNQFKRPALSASEGQRFKHKMCSVEVTLNKYGYTTRVIPTDCAPTTMQAINKHFVGVQYTMPEGTECKNKERFRFSFQQ